MYHGRATVWNETLPGTHFDDAGDVENAAEGISNNSMTTASLTENIVHVISDSDSGDSLFWTQREVQPVRTVRRQRPEGDTLRPVAVREPHYEDNVSSGPDPAWESPVRSERNRKINQQRRRKQNCRRHIFPFLYTYYKKKCLTQRKSLTFQNAALGGFFKCMEEIKMKSRAAAVMHLVSMSVQSKKRCQDSRRDVSPFSDLDPGDDSEDNEEGSDIKIVVGEIGPHTSDLNGIYFEIFST
ncbi:hypothetical protein AAFF_G00127600 [Aldrovandia affinis]|uniref:Uncharacterized protein n=1 Tax=Aldrovandia affinis TaxID=143900 RepID=A0AAD7WY21_9TELE|nr:hypothetical protein AAFF_G00127600 [Aldrovandia affinis]